jgi:tRNA nucleotidyltransferase/poly(A) polymerase
LQDRIIRTPLQPRETLIDDPLRALRAIRFASQLSFDIEHNLLQALHDTEIHTLIRKKVSAERIGIEFSKMLHSCDPVRALHLLAHTGIARVLLFDSLAHWDAGSTSTLVSYVHAYAVLPPLPRRYNAIELPAGTRD